MCHPESGRRIRNHNQILVRLSGKTPDGKTINRTVETGFTTEMGVKDWTEPAMGMREFVSNALDRQHIISEHTGKSPNYEQIVRIVDDSQVRAKAGSTRIFLSMDHQPVYEFNRTLSKRFLHFGDQNELKQKILKKRSRNLVDDIARPVIYKKGVMVREVEGGKLPSLFDYNFGEELNLDEARRVDDYSVRDAAERLLRVSEPETLSTIFKALIRGEEVWEGSLSIGTYVYGDQREQVEKNWKEAWRLAAGDAILLRSDISFLREMVERRGYVGVCIKSQAWVTACEKFGLPTDFSVLGSNDAREGRSIEEPTVDTLEALRIIWDKLVAMDLTDGKACPIVKQFDEPMRGESSRLGFYVVGTNEIFIHRSIGIGLSEMLLKVVLEEVAHYITGSTDNSRDFQDFAFRGWLRAMLPHHEGTISQVARVT